MPRNNPGKPRDSVTQRDVARIASVSIATVSHVLSGRDDRVSADTRARVLLAVRNSGYRPTARGHASESRPASIAFLVGDVAEKPILSNSYLSHLLDSSLQETMRNQGAITIFAERLWDVSGSSVRLIFDGRYDGVLSIAPRTDDMTLALLRDRGTPTVVIGSSGEPWGLSSIDVDNSYIGREAIAYLRRLGHEKIAYLSDNPKIFSNTEREQAARSVCPDLVSRRIFHDAELRSQEMKALVKAGITGFFCWNDEVAGHVTSNFTADTGMSREKFGFIGVDGVYPGVGYATFRQPLDVIGRRATELLFDHIRNPGRPSERVLLVPEFVNPV